MCQSSAIISEAIIGPLTDQYTHMAMARWSAIATFRGIGHVARVHRMIAACAKQTPVRAAITDRPWQRQSGGHVGRHQRSRREGLRVGRERKR